MSTETRSNNKYKFDKKVKIVSRKPRNDKKSFETLDSNPKAYRGRGNNNGQSRKINAENDSYGDKNRSNKIRNSGKRSVKSKTKNENIYRGVEWYGAVINGNGGFKPMNSDRKRKRIYGNHDIGEGKMLHNNVERPSRMSSSRVGKNRLKDYFVEEKRITKVSSRDIEQTTRVNSSIGGKKYKENQSRDKKESKNLRAKVKDDDKMKNPELESGGKDMLRKGFKIKSLPSKQLSQNQNKNAAEILAKYPKKKVKDKKSLTDDSELTDVRPKKKKRVIRIDPRDISNKRLDDGILTNAKTNEKKDEEKNKNVEMSMNAQFRAIQPSPSVLSFVEDNLLGRRREIELRRAGYNTGLSAPLDNIPSSTSSERERIEEPVFRNKLKFFAAAKISSSFPSPHLPEIAFAGRSNVGKSSLLNSLTRQWGVVRTSDKPGLTQTINFFELESKLCLVDLPGYGFAYAKEEVKESWEDLVKEYVSTRVGLKRVCLLIDTKWGMKPGDHELIDLMERSQTKYQIVLTKTDLVFPIDVARRAMQIEEGLKAKKSAIQPAMMVSSKTGAGMRSLRTVLAKVARFAKL